MEVITIEKQTFEMMMTQTEICKMKVEALFRESDEKRMSKWLDNQDVCRMLDISLRTLQSMRDSGKLAYSQIGSKMYYKPEDVEAILHRLSSQ